MAGTMPNLVPGYKASSASAIRWADECQNVALPCKSFQVSNFTLASCSMGRLASQTWPSTSAANTFRANPSDIDCAICMEVIPLSYSRTEPSGSVILIIYNYDLKVYIKVFHAITYKVIL